MLFEENRSKWVIGDGVYVVEEPAAGKGRLAELKRARKDQNLNFNQGRY